MKFIADFHIHSHFSRATSKTLTPGFLDYHAGLKGIKIVGTGDFTHPGWLAELKEKTEPDGRPILGLDSRDLLEIVLDCSENNYFIPAHIWTPWFSMLGSKSGFDSLEECFADLAPHIHTIETGLSTDPPMNWLCSFLDNVTLVSNSDAHSPDKLGRNANVFNTEQSYHSITEALRTGNPEKYLGTIDMFPQIKNKPAKKPKEEDNQLSLF